jgi:hypothetical protein
MRYRTRLGVIRILTWLAFAIIVATSLAAWGLPAWLASAGGLLILLAFLPVYQWSYWDILPDRLVEQRLFRRSVMLFVEIVSLSPISISSDEDEAQPRLIHVRGVAGRRILVETPQSRKFVQELLEHLPPLPEPPPD